ncbi:MAG: hypothetical protein ACI9EQ_002303 [Bacteroidia bacterium]|jgi:hypothetical protein
MKKSIIILFAVCMMSSAVFAQNEMDALRYSQLNVLGTARASAMGGAFGALGGDMSSMSINPAGIGVFNKATASATISILSAGTNATYLGTNTSDNKLNMNIGNAGFVARFKRKKASEKQWAWKAFHIGASYNRTASFQRRTTVLGVNSSSSLVDSWVGQLNNAEKEYTDIPTDLAPGAEFTNAFLGWGTFLIDTMPGSTNSYLNNATPFFGQTEQVRETTKGSMGEIALTFGGNFGNKLYIGATVGIPRINYELERVYTESDTQDTIADFSSFTKTDYLKTSGSGFNFKFGLLYRPVKWLRLGGAVHTPTFFEIDEAFSSVVTSNIDDSQYTLSTVEGNFDYSLQTPFRAIASLGFVIGKVGLFSAEYEYVNYSLAKFSSRNYSFNSENTNVKNRLHWAGNIRVGTEWRIKKLSVRGGFGINGDPFTGGYNFDNTRYSLGLGYRFKKFFTDLTYNLHRTASAYEVYGDAELAGTVTLNNSILMTFGFRF